MDQHVSSRELPFDSVIWSHSRTTCHCMMLALLDLLSAACVVPSGDGKQGWRWHAAWACSPKGATAASREVREAHHGSICMRDRDLACGARPGGELKIPLHALENKTSLVGRACVIIACTHASSPVTCKSKH
jgi:hypothetical protein